MEVAGLVLSAYPAAILVFEQYKTGTRYFANWAQFRRKYEAFIRDMEGQQLFFEGILEDLMCGGPDPFLTGTSSKNEFLGIVNDATFTGWRNPILKVRLRSRLDTRYDWCIHTIQRIYDILEELGELMNVQELDSSDQTADWWRLQWKRITQALFEDRYEGHVEAKRLIEELRQMIELSDKQRLQGVRIDSSFAPFFRKIWQTSSELYEVLKAGWHCHCIVSHKALLRLERRIENLDSNFNILFILPSVEAQCSRLAENTECIEQEVQVIVSEPEAGHKSLDTPSEESIDAEVAAISEKTVPSSGHLQRRSIFSVSSKSSRSSLVSKSKDKKPFFQIESTDLASRLRNKFRGMKTSDIVPQTRPKKVEYAAATIKHFTVSRSMQQQVRLDEEPVSKSCTLPSPGSLVESIETPTVKTSNSKYSSETKASAGSLIPDLCTALREPPSGTSLGYFVGKNQNHLELLAVDGHIGNMNDGEKITLEQILKGELVKPYQFSAEKKANLATILASSLLQLQHTHWLKDNWTRKDIFFKNIDGNVLFDQPYLSRSFISSNSMTGNTQANTPPTSSEISNFNPKSSLECLGIVLVELCFGVPIETHKDKVRLRPVDSSAESNHEFCLAIARAWTWQEIREQDPLFSDPINSCFNFPGLTRFQDGRSDEVVHDIYSLIIKPLYDETMRRWPLQRGLTSRYWV